MQIRRMRLLMLSVLVLCCQCSGPIPKRPTLAGKAVLEGNPDSATADSAADATEDQEAVPEAPVPVIRPSAPEGTFNDPGRNITVDALIPTYSATSIASFTLQTQILPMRMNHQSQQIDAAAFTNCANCHPDIGVNGSFFPGLLHSSLATLKLAAPSACTDCHSDSMPTGFVGPKATSPVRSPASGEMKHDAVAWANGAATATSLVSKECQTCHTNPTQTLDATWASGVAAAPTPLYHASLSAAAQPQPGSCVDCHANTRPNAVLSSLNATLSPTLSFDHTAPAALGECKSCHVRTDSWTGGKFHLPGDPTPATCVSCHQGGRPTSTAAWRSLTYTASPFDYVTNSQGITHGKGLDCVGCHTGPGTGAWGVNQNWIGGKFLHGPKTASATTCVACHTTQRPDLQAGSTAATAAALLGFDHAVDGTGDCFGCHQATVGANSYVNYGAPGTGKLPGGDWKGGVNYPGSTLISGMDQFIRVIELALNRSGTPSLVTSTTATSATLYNSMLHTSSVLPVQLFAGPTGNPSPDKCWHCHTNTNGVVTSYANGQYHSALTTFRATLGAAVTPLPQPTAKCSECHAAMQPNNIVQKNGQVLEPMDHDALFKTAVSIGGKSVSGVVGIDCSGCHKSPGEAWNDGVFHANIGAAVPADCTSCHYPLMADKAKSDVNNDPIFAMAHRSTQLKFQNCETCHGTALGNATQIPTETLWNPGEFHASIGTQPSACIDCHAVSKPKANVSTQSSWAYLFNSGGGSSSNTAQWMNHGSSQLGGRDCVTCHAGDAKASNGSWNPATLFHTVVPKPSSCQECHGTTNGGGTVPGINNNLPQGLSSSTTLTSASATSTTGIPAGTRAQISHADINVKNHDCSYCHTQIGKSTVSGIAGAEWAQAKFHPKFSTATPLLMNGTTGRCSNCHMNVKPGTNYLAQNHSAFTSVSGSTDCSSCHALPGTGTITAPNWRLPPPPVVVVPPPPPPTTPPPAGLPSTGTMSVAFTPVRYSGANYSAFIYAIWVTDSGGRYVKTIDARAATRIRYLSTWLGSAGVATNAATSQNPDGNTGATLSYPGTLTAIVRSWNLRDKAGVLVPQGNYIINFQMTSANNAGVNLKVPLTIGPNGTIKTDTSQATGITAVSIKHTP